MKIVKFNFNLINQSWYNQRILNKVQTIPNPTKNKNPNTPKKNLNPYYFSLLSVAIYIIKGKIYPLKL